jgi:hypothetical protein
MGDSGATADTHATADTLQPPRDAGTVPDAGRSPDAAVNDAAPPSSDAAAADVDARTGAGYDGGRVVTLVLTDPRDTCTLGNVNCMGVNMPLILTGTPGVVTDVPTICVQHGAHTAWAFEPALCSYGVCRQIGEDPFYPPGCVRGCAVPKKWGGYPAGTSPLCY